MKADAREMTNVSVKMEKQLKIDYERILGELGLSMSAGFTVFAKAVVRNGGMPFEMLVDPFDRSEHQAELCKAD